MSKKVDIACDKCGQPISCSGIRTNNIRDNSALIHIWGVGYYRGVGCEQRLDLCPECYEKFVNWLESESEDNNG